MSTTTHAYAIDPMQIRQALEIYLTSGQVTELRALNCRVRGEYRTGTYSGYFDNHHINDLIEACEQIEFASGIYFVPNPINPDLYSRSYNHARIVVKEPLTGDRDIVSRRWLLIDVDPVRPAGISATAEEKYHAESVLMDVDCELYRRGFPAGIIADSGNGSHLCIPIDMPADDGGVVQRLLSSLAKQFDTHHAKVDISVFNPARIWKLPGTMSCKGDNCPELGRVWRMSRIVQVCKEVPNDA